MELTGVGRWRALPMSGPKKFESRENRWVWHLPSRYATHLAELSGQLTEDGRPLFRAVSHKEVRQHGSGRFRLHGRLVSFAPWDNSDPSTYVFHAPRPVNRWLLWGGLALVIAAHAGARLSRRPRSGWIGEATGDSCRWMRPAGFVVGLLVAALLVRALMILGDPEHTDGYMMVRGMPYSDAAWWCWVRCSPVTAVSGASPPWPPPSCSDAPP
jgi:hypothetical protein